MSPKPSSSGMRISLATTTRGARVLIVEDDSRLRKLMSDVLALDGCTVTGAGETLATCVCICASPSSNLATQAIESIRVSLRCSRCSPTWRKHRRLSMKGCCNVNHLLHSATRACA